MVRPRDADSAALEEVRETRPRNAISMRRVAQRAGVSLGTVQYYFENKETLLEACLDGYYRCLATTGAALLDDIAGGTTEPGSATVVHVMQTFYRFIHEERAFLELRLITNALRGELHPRRQPEFMADIIARAAGALLPHVTVSELDVRLAIQMLAYGAIRMALMSEGEQRAVSGLDGDEAEDAVESFVVRTACRMMRPAS